MSLRNAMLLLVPITVSFVLLAGVKASVATTGRQAVCPAGTVKAVTAGKSVCLKSGQRCVRRLDARYHRYGFDCVVGRLIRRSGWVITDLGSGWRPDAINEPGEVVGTKGRGFTGYDTPPDQRPVIWQRGRLTFLAPPGYGQVRAINDTGQVIGWIVLKTGGGYLRFLWQDGARTELGMFPIGLNERGQVVGNSPITASGERASLWDKGVLTDLGDLGGPYTKIPDKSSAVINERGRVLVQASNAASEPHIAVWENGILTDLGALLVRSYPVAINERDQILLRGSDNATRYEEQAFLWDEGVLRDLGSLSGGETHPRTMNGYGQVIGTSMVGADHDAHAFLWQDGTMQDLGTLGGRESYPFAINEHGQIVGMSQTKSGHMHAFLWQNGKMTDLSPVAELESNATALNERGQIVGSISAGARTSAVLWRLKRG